MSIEEAFGVVLRQVRVEKHLSQEDLGDRSGLHRTYISLLERGLKSPSLSTLFRLSRALEIQPHILIKLTEQQDIQSH